MTEHDDLVLDANGVAMPARGLGTWRLRGDACVEAVSHAMGVGYRHIDTAQMYENEIEVGEGLKDSRLPREQFFITSKIWPDRQHEIERATEYSLRALDLDQLDLMLLHWPNPSIPVKETSRSLQRLVEEKLTRAVGIANAPTALLAETVARLDVPLACNQVEYHPFLNQSRVIEACAKHGVRLVAYCPIAKGKISDTRQILEIGEAHGKTAAQVTLRWHFQQGVVAIPKTATPERIEENFGIMDFSLSEDEMAAISALAVPDGRLVDPAFAPNWDQV